MVLGDGWLVEPSCDGTQCKYTEVIYDESLGNGAGSNHLAKLACISSDTRIALRFESNFFRLDLLALNVRCSS